MHFNVKPAATRRETRADWLIVVTSTLALTVSVVHVYSIGMFIAPLQREFGWSRGEITAGLGVISVVSVILAPLIGYAIDRFGSRRIGLPGLAVYCAGVALLSTATGSLWQWWSMWILVGLGTVLIKPTVWVTAIAARFDARRGIAMAVALCGTSIGTAIMPSVAAQLLALVDWRVGYLILGLGSALIVLPTVFLFFKDHRTAGADRLKRSTAQLPGLGIREGFRSSHFVKMAIVALLVTMCVLSLTVHFVPMMQDRGFTPAEAGFMAVSIGLGSIVGRIGTGLLLDRFHGPYIGGISYILPIIACVMLLNFTGSTTVGIAIGFTVGLALGAEIDIAAYLAARYFGLRNYGILFGTVAGLISLGAGTGPAVTGFIYDSFGSYHYALMLFIPLLAISAILIVSLGRYPQLEQAESGAPSVAPA